MALRVRTPWLIFTFVFVVLFWLFGNRLVLTNDEGILLEPARMMARGARPYVDFFGYMSPGSYWIQAAFFRAFGVSYWVGRLPVLLDLSAQCALVFWLTSRLSSRGAGWVASMVFLGFQIADPSFLTAQHRWDSGTLALLGLAAILCERWVLSGALLAAAAWCTPSIGLVILVAGAWIAVLNRDRKGADKLGRFGGSVVAASLVAIMWLGYQGSLSAFVQQMQWLQKNYSGVNVMGYGAVIGGYGALMDGVTGLDAIVRALLVACIALPATLPLIAFALWVWQLRKETISPEIKRIAWLLIPASLAMVLTAFPRADIMHLSFVVALPYVLVAAALAHLCSRKAGAIVAFSVLPLALLFGSNGISGWFRSRTIASPAGTLRAEKDQAVQWETLLRSVQPGDSLYVHPYMPVHYFLTQSENPTRYSFLAPGMMTNKEESEALEELQSKPPQWVLFLSLGPEEFRRVFPNADPSRSRFQTLEAWLLSKYEDQTQPGVNLGGYRLMRRRGDLANALAR